MPKITIERETLERAMSALGPVGGSNARNAYADLRAALAAQPATVDDHLKCGHHRSLAINSAETGEFLYCDLCDAKSRCRDAETMEGELRAALAAQPAEPVAWLHICVKPGHREVYATVDPNDNKWWPADQWTSHTVHPLVIPPAPAAVPPDERVRVLREALTGWLEMGYSREREAATLDLLEATK